MRKLRPRFRLQNGTRFPVGASNGKRVPESGLRTGHAFRRRPQAETVFRIRRSEWDAFSGSALKRKLRPGIAAQNGMHFPPEPLTETASRNSAPEWDTFSGTALKRKLRPVLRPDSGTRFPLAWPLGKCCPDRGVQSGDAPFNSSYSSTSLSHVGSAVCRMPAVCSFLASIPAERTSLMVKRSRG